MTNLLTYYATLAKCNGFTEDYPVSFCVCVGMVGARLVYRWFGWFGIFSPWLAAAADDPAPLPPHARLENISWKKWQCHEKNWKWFPPMHFHQNSLLCDILVLQIKWIIIKNVNYFLTVRTLPKQLGRGEVGRGGGGLPVLYSAPLILHWREFYILCCSETDKNALLFAWEHVTFVLQYLRKDII